MQRVKVGDGPRYTNTFLPSTLSWKRGEPPPQPSSVTLYFVASCVRLANVVTPVLVKLMPLLSFAVDASDRSETSFTWFPDIVAPPNSVPEAASADGTSNAMPVSAMSMISRFIVCGTPFVPWVFSSSLQEDAFQVVKSRPPYKTRKLRQFPHDDVRSDLT